LLRFGQSIGSRQAIQAPSVLRLLCYLHESTTKAMRWGHFLVRTKKRGTAYRVRFGHDKAWPDLAGQCWAGQGKTRQGLTTIKANRLGSGFALAGPGVAWPGEARLGGA
jgi:hypothetical protein